MLAPECVTKCGDNGWCMQHVLLILPHQDAGCEHGAAPLQHLTYTKRRNMLKLNQGMHSRAFVTWTHTRYVSRCVSTCSAVQTGWEETEGACEPEAAQPGRDGYTELEAHAWCALTQALAQFLC